MAEGMHVMYDARYRSGMLACMILQQVNMTILNATMYMSLCCMCIQYMVYVYVCHDS